MAERSAGPLLLASASPRRLTLLRRAGIPCECEDPGDDGPPAGGSPADRVLGHARHKAATVGARHPERWVLAADTLVWLDGEPLGKPRDRADAETMLRGLAGREHEVWTGVCLRVPAAGGGRAWWLERADRARVAFRAIGEEELHRFLRSAEWVDKAGAYGIQGAAGAWAEVVEGDRETVVGLSTATVADLLAQAAACPQESEG